MTHSEAVRARTVQLDCVSSDIGASLQSYSFNRGDYIVSSDRNLWLKNHHFYRETAKVTVKSIPMEYDLSFLARREPENAEPSELGVQKARKLGSQKSKIPGIQ